VTFSASQKTRVVYAKSTGLATFPYNISSGSAALAPARDFAFITVFARLFSVYVYIFGLFIKKTSKANFTNLSFAIREVRYFRRNRSRQNRKEA
jgi:hypothetical protein